MKGYVYMIDYYTPINDASRDYDQVICDNQDDLITQCKLLGPECIVERIKLVNQRARFVERPISATLYERCKRVLQDRLQD